VGLCHRNEVSGAEVTPDAHLMLDRPSPRRPGLAGQHRALFIGKPHVTIMLGSVSGSQKRRNH
jgi:hypothetical protein